MDHSKNTNPTIVARETLKQLASSKIPPTPVNYQTTFHQTLILRKIKQRVALIRFQKIPSIGEIRWKSC